MIAAVYHLGWVTGEAFKSKRSMYPYKIAELGVEYDSQTTEVKNGYVYRKFGLTKRLKNGMYLLICYHSIPLALMWKTFDYNFHQAMFEVPTNDQPPGMVLEVVQHGYALHDRLLRPAMVGVSKAADKAEPMSEEKE